MRYSSYMANEPLTNEQLMRKAPAIFATQPAGEVSDRYQFIPTIELVEGLRQHGWYPVEATQTNSRLAGQRDVSKHMLRFRNLDDPIKVGDDVIDAVLLNSHNRTSSAEMLASIMRQICANGLHVSQGDLGSYKVRHTGDAVRDVIEGTYQIIHDAPKIADLANEMKGIELNRDEREIFALTAFDYLNPQPKDDDAPQLVTDRKAIANQILQPVRRYGDNGHDLWTTFNVIQEKAIKGGIRTLKLDPRKGYRRSTSRAVKSIDKNVAINKALWAMAEQMKALKS